MRRVAVTLVLLLASCTVPNGSEAPEPETNTSPPETIVFPDTEVIPTTLPGAPNLRPPEGLVRAVVVHVQDGDSMIVEIDGVEERVRLIGINAPEHDECWGDEARAHLRTLEGTEIGLSFDVEERDHYDRLLAYVWAEGALFNAELVLQGSALAQAFEPNIEYQHALDGVEGLAKGHRAGLWSSTACGDLAPTDVVITHVEANPPGPDEENLTNEYVVIEHRGSSGTYGLGGMVLRDSSTRHRYVFPDGVTLGPGGTLIVVTGCGVDTDALLHWCADGPVWSNSGDEALLQTELGTIVAHYEYP